MTEALHAVGLAEDEIVGVVMNKFTCHEGAADEAEVCERNRTRS